MTAGSGSHVALVLARGLDTLSRKIDENQKVVVDALAKQGEALAKQGEALAKQGEALAKMRKTQKVQGLRIQDMNDRLRKIDFAIRRTHAVCLSTLAGLVSPR